MDYTKTAHADSLNAARTALEANGFTVLTAENGEDARNKTLALIPEGAEVMTMTSITLETLGITEAIDGSGKYDSVRNKLNEKATSARDKKRLGAAPEWTIGSVHAVTETGTVMIASNTGSQLPAYAYGADHVIWVVGTQKIVKDVEEGKKRIYDYVLPKETVRARAAYGLPDTFNSNVSKLLTVNKEVASGRITVILVNEAVGF